MRGVHRGKPDGSKPAGSKPTVGRRREGMKPQVVAVYEFWFS